MAYTQLPALHQSGVSSLTFTADGSLLCSTDLEGGVALWDFRNPTAAAALLVGHKDAVNCAAAFTDCVRLATAGEDNSALLWDIRNPSAPLGHFAGVGVGVNRLALGTSDSLLYSAADDGCVIAHNTQSGEIVEKWMAAGAAINDLTVIKGVLLGGIDLLVTGGEDSSVRTWIGGTPVDVATYRDAHPAPPRTAPDADDADADEEDPVSEELQCTAVPRLVDSVDEFETAVNHVHFDGASSSLLVACAHCMFEFGLSTDSGAIARSEEATVYQGHEDYIRGIATSLSPTGERLAYTTGDDRTIAVWHPGTGNVEPVQRFVAHNDIIMGFALSPCGTLLATGSEDGVIRVWTLPFSKEL